jgi:two-component system, sensor histidine kinase and response regulator
LKSEKIKEDKKLIFTLHTLKLQPLSYFSFHLPNTLHRGKLTEMSTILVIEDDFNYRHFLQDFLESQDFQVLLAQNGKTGLFLLHKQKPDLVICDIQLPEIDGYGVLQSLRQNPDTANIPFIFLTSEEDETHYRRGMKLGANAYLIKPVVMNALLRIVSALLFSKEFGKREMTKENQQVNSNHSMFQPWKVSY